LKDRAPFSASVRTNPVADEGAEALFAALDGLKRISTRFAHVREILIRTDAAAGTVLNRPNWPTGTEVGSAFD